MHASISYSYAGEKFYSFLQQFSTHIVEEVLKRNAPGKNTIYKPFTCNITLLDDYLLPNYSQNYATHAALHGVHVTAMKKMVTIHSSRLAFNLLISTHTAKPQSGERVSVGM